MMLTPYNILLWGTTAGMIPPTPSIIEGEKLIAGDIYTATLYAMGRKIFGHNTWFSD
jgi:hypothetical protein